MRETFENRPVDVRARLDEGRAALVDLARARGVRFLALFGSLARGETHPRSDIDLAVDFGRRVSGDESLGFLGRVMDVLRTDRVQVVDVRTATPLLMRDIALDGVPLYEADPHAFAAFHMKALGIYMDTAPFRRLLSQLLRARRRADG